MRVSKLLREANIGLETLAEILKTLGVEVGDLGPMTHLSDYEVSLIRNLCNVNKDLMSVIEEDINKSVQSSTSPLKIVGQIDLEGFDNQFSNKIADELSGIDLIKTFSSESPKYNESSIDFWLEEIVIQSLSGGASRLSLGNFVNSEQGSLYSVMIGSNGVGKSSILREIVEFFIDLHSSIDGVTHKPTNTYKSRLKGVKYHIDGICCEVIRMEKSFLTRIDNKITSLKFLRLPSVVACHFGAFEKFPIQRVNGASLTRYDVPYYKYVGAHVNGSMISSSAIAFRLLFALNDNMDDNQRHNIASILDFIGYDHTISLQYSIVKRSKKSWTPINAIKQCVEKDKEFCNYSVADRNNKINQLYDLYKRKTSSDKPLYHYEINIDDKSKVRDSELESIYKLKQYDIVNSANVIFHKHDREVTSEEMSSGEFTMLSMVLSVSAAATDSHTLVLLDEPELSQHPNWQMTLIDNMDRALKDKMCHLLIATHSHMVVSDLPVKRSYVAQLCKDINGNIYANAITDSTYGWSAEEVLLKVFKTATDRNRYFGERISKLLEQMSSNTINPEAVAAELKDLQEISIHLSDVDPMKMILNTIVEAYR